MNLLRRTLLSNKVITWAILYLAGMTFFTAFRILFLCAHYTFLKGASLDLILKSFLIGFRFDTAVIAASYLPLFILTILPVINLNSPAYRKIIALILTIIYAFFFLVLSADLRFFDVYGSRLNFWAIEFMADTGEYFYSIITFPGFWILLALWIGMTAAFYWAVRKLFEINARSNPASSRIGNAIGCLLLLAFFTIGARGGLGMKPLDWGAAIFSDNHLLNQASLNGVYTLSHSIYEEYKEGRNFTSPEDSRFAFMNKIDAYNTVRTLLDIDSSSARNDLSLEHHVSGKPRYDFQPNIVIVIMESWSADKIDALGAKLNVSPHFDSLCNKGILFTQFYANGVRTNHGIPAILCTFPYVSGRSIMRRYAAEHSFRSLAETLKDYNYTNIFAYGGDIEFDNMQGFLRAAGYEKFYAERDFDRSKKLGKWGIPDHNIFEKLAREIQSFKRPFNLAIMTLSNHDPYLIPDERFRLYNDTIADSKRLNTFYYSDWAIGQFIDSLRQYPSFDSTIFVFTADHCPYQTGPFTMMPKNFRIPLLIYAPKLIGDSAVVINRTGSQVDIIPTIIGLLGLTADEYTWGRDLLDLPQNDSGFAVIVSDEKLGFINGPFFFFEWLNHSEKSLYDLREPDYFKDNLIARYPNNASAMEKNMEAYIQLANYLSRGGRKK